MSRIGRRPSARELAARRDRFADAHAREAAQATPRAPSDGRCPHSRRYTDSRSCSQCIGATKKNT